MTLKRCMAIMVLLAVMLSVSACGARIESEEKGDTSMFVAVEKADGFWVVYHKQTKVMYAVSCGHYNIGTFTILLNSDGTPMLWEEN